MSDSDSEPELRQENVFDFPFQPNWPPFMERYGYLNLVEDIVQEVWEEIDREVENPDHFGYHRDVHHLILNILNMPINRAYTIFHPHQTRSAGAPLRRADHHRHRP